jgi:hypothetical protein
MKLLFLVMLLITLPLLECAAQSVDQEVTVVGRDETVMSVPELPAPEPVQAPAPDLWLPDTPASPVVLPPPAPEQPAEDPAAVPAPAG